jgi:type IX secretion system PorP/SprF family membrane protein
MHDNINLTLIHRSQWTSIVQPFSTSQFEGTLPIRKANTNKKVAVISGSFINDRVGEGGYLRTNHFSLAGAYLLDVGKSQLSLGAKVGYFNGITDIGSIQTGSQFVNGNYNSSVGIGEDLTNPVVRGIEVSPSMTFFQNDSLGLNKFNFGVTAFNVNQPKNSQLVAGYKLPMRFSIVGGYTHSINMIAITPRALAMVQGTQTHVLVGADVAYYLSKTSEKIQGIALGGAYRLNDAAVLGLKYLSNTFNVGVSYDINTSSLSDPIGKKAGSFEVFLNYKIKQEDKVKQYFLLVNVFEEDSITPLKAKAEITNVTRSEREASVMFADEDKGSMLINQKEEYKLVVSKDGYNTEEFTLTQASGEDFVQDVILTKKVKFFELELDMQDKETGEPVKVELFVVNPETGEEESLGTHDKINKEFEVGPEHTIIARAEGYDDAEMTIQRDKEGTVSKTLFMDKELKAANLKLTVLDESTKKPIKTNIIATSVSGDNANESSVIAMNNLPPASYPLKINNNFEILISKEGYFNKTEKIEVTEMKDIEKVVMLTPIEVGASIVVEDLLFKTGKTDLDERSYRILDQLVDFMNQNPTVKIELQGHTDSDGSSSSNQKLSEGRAQAAVDYLVNKGIDRSRMTAKGYGESEPRATNSTAEGKALNRRVELKITGK